MDDLQNQDGVEREAEPAVSQPASQPGRDRLSLPKIQFEGLQANKIVLKLKEYKRVLQITKKPDMEEFKTIVKASAIGIAVIGTLGFVIAIIAQIITT